MILAYPGIIVQRSHFISRLRETVERGKILAVVHTYAHVYTRIYQLLVLLSGGGGGGGVSFWSPYRPPGSIITAAFGVTMRANYRRPLISKILRHWRYTGFIKEQPVIGQPVDEREWRDRRG